MISRTFFSARNAVIFASCVTLNAASFSADETKAVTETPLMTSRTMPRILDLDATLKGAKELWLVV